MGSTYNADPSRSNIHDTVRVIVADKHFLLIGRRVNFLCSWTGTRLAKSFMLIVYWQRALCFPFLASYVLGREQKHLVGIGFE